MLRAKLTDGDICLLHEWSKLQDEYLEQIPKALDNRDLWIVMEAAGDVERELAKNPVHYVGNRDGDTTGYISEKLARLNAWANGEDPIRPKEYWR
jgi:hypothetical protein